MQIGGTRHGGPHIGVASVIGAGFALPRDAGRRPALRRPRDSARSAMRERRADAGRRISAGTPTGSVTRRQGNADLWSAQPAGGGRREGPRLQGWFASRPGPRRSALSGRTPFAALRAAVPTGGRRSKPSPRFFPVGEAWVRSREIGVAQRRWGRFRAAARCRSGDVVGAALRCRSGPALHGAALGAGFALPRDAGRRPALHGAALVVRVSRCTRDAGRRPALHALLVRGAHAHGGGGVGGAGFALHARCRSETGAPWGRRWWCGFRAAARCRSETGAPWGSVVGAGFALTRDAGRRPALHGAALVVRVSRSRAMPVGTGAPCAVGGGVGGAGFALTRDAGRRPALQGAALVVRVSRSRAMPVGDRRSMGRRRWGGFRAHARCRSRPPPGELAGAPGRPRDSTRTSERAKNTWQRTSGSLPAISGECVKGGILPFHKTERGESRAQTLERSDWVRGYPKCGFRAHARCRSETGAPGGGVGGAGFALPRDAGRRPALHALLVRVSRCRAMAGRRPALLAVPAIQRELPSAQKTHGSEPLVRCRRFRGNV